MNNAKLRIEIRMFDWTLKGKKQTALHLACTRPTGNATNIIKVILSVLPKDARLIKDGDGNIPLFIALTAGTRGACQELLHHLAHEQMRMKAGPRNDTALHLAIRKRDLETGRIFVDSGANVDAKNVRGKLNYFKMELSINGNSKMESLKPVFCL